MSVPFNENVRGDRDNPGQVQHLEHFQQPSVAAASVAEERAAAVAGAAPDARILAREYLKEGAPIYGLAESELPDDAAVGLAAAAAATGSKLQLAEQKKMSDTTTISYKQTYSGLPVWESGTSITIQSALMRMTASHNSLHSDVTLPAADELQGPAYKPEDLTLEW